MALIPCPKCGNQISSLAVNCPYCRKSSQQTVSSDNVTTCPECGNLYDKQAKSCPNCGEPNNGPITFDTTNLEQPKTIVDYSMIFDIKEDEYYGIKYITTIFCLQDAKIIDGLEKKYNAIKPFIRIGHLKAGNGETRFLLEYNEQDIIDALKENGVSPENYGFGEDLKGIIVTINGTETFKLSIVNDEINNVLPIEKEQFLKCCNANSIQFKIFRKNGESFIIAGDKENTQLMIDCFRGLYNYIEDETLYSESLIRLQQWAENEKAKYEEQKKQEEAKQAAIEAQNKAKGERNTTIGIVAILVGIILFIIGLSDIDGLFIVFLILSLISIIGGGAFLLYGYFKKQGLSDEAALNGVTEVFRNLKI